MIARRHPMALARTALELCGGLTVLIWLDSKMPPVGFVPGLIGLAILALFGRSLWKLARWHVDRFVITNTRVLMVAGLVNRQVSMLPLRKLTDMSYRRSSLGMLLGYGEFVMESAGEAQGLRRVRFLPHPDELYLQLSELLFVAEGVLATEEH
jgi:hypothetical protein